MKRITNIVRLCLIIMSFLPIAACESTEQVLIILDKVKNELEVQPAKWDIVMHRGIDDLKAVGSELAHETLGEMQSILNVTLGYVQAVTGCAVDYVAEQVQLQVQNIINRLTNTPLIKAPPRVCVTDPAVQIEPGDQSVSFFGLNFLSLSEERNFRTALAYADGQVEKIPFGHVVLKGNYQLTVDIQSKDLHVVDRTRGPRLVLMWGDDNVKFHQHSSSALPIILPRQLQEIVNKTIRIDESKLEWDTGIDIQPNDRLRFDASGKLTMWVKDDILFHMELTAGPEGTTFPNPCLGTPSIKAPEFSCYSLLGRIDKLFYIGPSTEHRHNQTHGGRLFLVINDIAANDGSGENPEKQWTVQIHVLREI